MLVAAVRRAIREHAMIAPGMRVLVGCSGGPDSTALLVALARLAPEVGFEILAASVDHGVRADAAQEIALVERLALRLAVRHVRVNVDVAAAVRSAARTKRSPHAVARTLRYRALFTLAETHACERVAVGHTMDDQAETVLQRMLRGGGLAGLAAMRRVRPDGLVRPLLDVRRADVMAFLAAEREPAASDPSNVDRRHQRARLRADLMTRLQREDPRVVEHLAVLADEAHAVLEAQAADATRIAAACLREEERDGAFRLDALVLNDAPPHLRASACKLVISRIVRRPVRVRWTASLVSLVAAGGSGEVPWPGWTASRASGDRWVHVRPGVVSVRGRPASPL